MKEAALRIDPLENRQSPEWWGKYINPKEGESPEAYFRRVTQSVGSEAMLNDLFSEGKKDLGKIEDVYPKVEEAMLPQIETLLKNPRHRRTREDLTEQFLSFKNGMIGSFRNGLVDVEDKEAYFSKTNTERSFFEHESFNSASIYRLFGLPERNAMTGRPLEESMQSILESRINGKVIYMLGGGDYGRDFLASDLFSPKQIVNIDPYHPADAVEKNRRKNYISLPVGAESAELAQELKAEHIPKADEIWATYSVPMYLETKEQIIAMFDNIDAILATGGVARIYPLRLMNFAGEGQSVFKADDWEDREQVWIGSILKLLKTGKYNFEIVSHAMRLEKIAD